MVPRLRIAGCAICGIARAISGACFAMSEERSRVTWRGIAPIFLPAPSSIAVTLWDMIANGTKEFSLPSLEGYMDAAVLAEGLRRAGPAPTRAAVLAGLERIEAFDLGGVKINFGKTNREGNQFVDVAVISTNGRLLS